MRQLLVFGDKTFRITVPDDARVTFGPFSPPRKDQGFRSEMDKAGTLRVYGPKAGKAENVLGVWSGVTGFRDLSVGYAEQVAKEEGATIWKDDEDGYVREHKVSRTNQWVNDPMRKQLRGEIDVTPKKRARK